MHVKQEKNHFSYKIQQFYGVQRFLNPTQMGKTGAQFIGKIIPICIIRDEMTSLIDETFYHHKIIIVPGKLNLTPPLAFRFSAITSYGKKTLSVVKKILRPRKYISKEYKIVSVFSNSFLENTPPPR